MKKYFFPFTLDCKETNFILLFRLYTLAQYNKETKLYDIIPIESKKKLSCGLRCSGATLSRFLRNNAKNALYFTCDDTKQIIKLNNNFTNRQDNRQFVCITEEELLFLLE